MSLDSYNTYNGFLTGMILKRVTPGDCPPLALFLCGFCGSLVHTTWPTDIALGPYMGVLCNVCSGDSRTVGLHRRYCRVCRVGLIPAQQGLCNKCDAIDRFNCTNGSSYTKSDLPWLMKIARCRTQLK